MLLNFVGRAQGDLVVLLILFAEVVSYFAISPCAVSYSPLLQPHFIFVIISSVMGSLVTRVSI